MTESAVSPRFGMLFVMVARRWRTALDTQLANAGLTDATWAPLVHIEQSGGGISQKDLAARVGIDGSSLVRLLDILSSKHLIERRQSPDDRRTNLLYVTDEGRKSVRRIQYLLDTIEGRLLADMDTQHVHTLVTTLETIDARIRELLETTR